MAKAYRRSMSSQELVVWLQDKGLSQKDSQILEDQDFTGESFLLLNKAICKDLGIGLAGQLMLETLLQKAASESEMISTDTSREEPIDLARGDEVRHFCTSHSPQDEGDEYDYGCRDPSTAAACIFRDKIWKGRQVLRVFFLNPKVLRQWPGLTTDKIIEWAEVWHNKGGDIVPCFTETKKMEKADIRVKFTDDNEACWSKVGMEADKIKSPQPTMVLNLKEYETTFQRSLVIHEFGHALGLEHEHQRSDFWDVIKKYVDSDRMESDPRLQEISIKGKPGFQRDWFKKETSRASKSEYDPDSIMHYWFDSDWLINPKHRRLRSVDSDDSLNSEHKKYIKGLHKRQRTQQLALDPSARDIEQLQIVYGAHH